MNNNVQNTVKEDRSHIKMFRYYPNKISYYPWKKCS